MPPWASSSMVGAEVLVGSVIGRKKREVPALLGGGSVSGGGSSSGCGGCPPEPASAGSSSGCWPGRPPVVLDPESEPASPAEESLPDPASEELERPPFASPSSESSVETSQATAPKAKTESTSAHNRTVIGTPSR